MGNTADKSLPLPLPQAKAFSPTQPAPSNPIPVPPPKEAQTNLKLLEAIKKRDIILLKKAIERYQVKPTEIIGSSDQAKTVLHKLAEHNFSEGMTLFLEEMSKHNMPLQISRILNMKDSDGNTPMLLCCLANAVETLEVLSRCEYIDMEVQNCARKTALEIAMEMESSCVHVLTSLTAGSNPTTKATIKGSMEGSQQIRSLDEASKGFPLEKDEDLISDGNDTRTSLDCRSPMLPQGKNSNNKDLKEFQENTNTKRNGKLWETLNTDNNISSPSFVDIEFPHEIYFLEDEYYEGTLIKKFPKLKWVRASNFLGLFPDTLTIFDHFEPNVVSKTPLAGCEIYSALAAMAEFPQRLTKVFNTKDVSKFGAYSVNFTVAGVPIEIILDDYFPSTDGSQFLYSRSISNELWFSLLEKAFAKLHGGYHALDGIGIAEALETLTGMPVAQRAMKDAEEDKLWAKLMDYDKRNYIVCAGERKLCHNGFKNRIYTVISIIEAANYRLVKLRNHFDDYSWEGNFSHSSPLWTEQLKEQVGYCATEKTSFYMELRDFMDQFESLTVCHYHDKWVRSTVQTVCKPNHPVYFELNVEKEMEAYISVHQKDPKFVEEDPGYGISPVEIILARDLDGTGLESIAFGERDAFLGKSAVYVHESHKVKLQPGKYLIYVKIRWVDYDAHDFFLNVLSSLPAKVSTVNQSNEFNFLEKVYLNAGIASKEKFNLMNDCQFASGWSGSHLWMYACNKTNKAWHLEITFEKMINLKLGKKYRSEENVIKFTIPPNDKVVAYAKRKSSAAVSVGWTFTQKLE